MYFTGIVMRYFFHFPSDFQRQRHKLLDMRVRACVCVFVINFHVRVSKNGRNAAVIFSGQCSGDRGLEVFPGAVQRIQSFCLRCRRTEHRGGNVPLCKEPARDEEFRERCCHVKNMQQPGAGCHSFHTSLV